MYHAVWDGTGAKGLFCNCSITAHSIFSMAPAPHQSVFAYPPIFFSTTCTVSCTNQRDYIKQLQGGVKSRKDKLPKNSKFVITLFVFLHCLSPGLFGFCRIRILRARRHCRIAAIGDFCLVDFSNFPRI